MCHLPAYCKSLCFGKKSFLRYWGHSRYWSILASKILGSDLWFNPLLDSILAFPDSSKTTTSSILKTARARAIYGKTPIVRSAHICITLRARAEHWTVKSSSRMGNSFILCQLVYHKNLVSEARNYVLKSL